MCALLLLDLECVLKASYTRTKDENTFYREHILPRTHSMEHTFYKEHILQGEQAAAMEQQPVEEEGEAVETKRLSIARIMLENDRKRAAMLPSSNHAVPWDARYVTAIQPTSREAASSLPEAEMAHLISPREDIADAFLLLEQEQETVTEGLEMLESEMNSLYRAHCPQGEQDRVMQRTDAVRWVSLIDG